PWLRPKDRRPTNVTNSAEKVSRVLPDRGHATFSRFALVLSIATGVVSNARRLCRHHRRLAASIWTPPVYRLLPDVERTVANSLPIVVQVTVSDNVLSLRVISTFDANDERTSACQLCHQKFVTRVLPES